MRYVLLVFFTLLWSACGGSAEESEYSAVAERRAIESPPAAPAADANVQREAGTASPASPVADSVGLKIIRTATLRLRVDAFPQARAELQGILKGFDAYIANENETRGYGGLEGQLTIRVASAQFQALVDRILGLAEEVAYKEITAEDVTEQYVDTEARLRAKKAVEQRYLALLAQARSVEDILNVENNLRVIREEIESTEGRLRYLQSRVSYSTVNLNLFEGDFGASGGRPFWARLADAFGDGWEAFLSLLVGLVELWPLWLVLFGVGLPLRRWWLQRKARRAHVPSPPPM